eukprot:scaffold351_cov117-Isochrysis_galbana.AAC.5
MEEGRGSVRTAKGQWCPAVSPLVHTPRHSKWNPARCGSNDGGVGPPPREALLGYSGGLWATPTPGSSPQPPTPLA